MIFELKFIYHFREYDEDVVHLRTEERDMSPIEHVLIIDKAPSNVVSSNGRIECAALEEPRLDYEARRINDDGINKKNFIFKFNFSPNCSMLFGFVILTTV